MAGVSTSRGIDINAFKNQALAQANGQQKTYYLGLLATAIGSNPYIRILSNGVIKYEDRLSGSLNVQGSAILLPVAFDEPAEIMLGDALSATKVVEIVNASNSGIALIIPLALPGDAGASGCWVISGPLQAGVAIKTSGLRILAPDTLDLGGTGGTATQADIDRAVDNMKLLNDYAVTGINQSAQWATRGQNIMGNIPRGTNTPSWWNPSNQAFKSSAWWNAFESWGVLFIGNGHTATNVRVNMKDDEVWIKSKATGLWTLRGQSHTLSGELFLNSLQGGPQGAADIRYESDGSISVKAPTGQLFHMYGVGRTYMDGSDVAAVFTRCQARLVLDNLAGTDDRNLSHLQMHVGMDYYPSTSTTINDFAPTGFNPGAGISRMVTVTNNWQEFSYTSLDGGVVPQDPGGGLTEAAFRAAPPPHLVVVGQTGGGSVAPPPTTGIAMTLLTVNSTPVQVSPTLFGAQFHCHPTPRPGDLTWAAQGGTDSDNNVPPMFIKSIGSLARIGCTWAAVVREGWQWYDTWKAYGNSFGAIRNYTLFQTPNELAEPGYSANNSYWPTFNPGGDKGNVPPVAGAAKTYVKSLLQRDPTLNTLETWNEYEIYPTGYWQGTPQQMARVMRECKEAKTEVGHAVKILWPGMVNWDYSDPNTGFTNWAELANADDGAGGTAKDHIDGIGHHIYSSTGTTALSMAIYFSKVQASMDAMGKSALPKYMTEGAMIPDGQYFDPTLASNIYGWQYALCAINRYVACNAWSMDRGPTGNWGQHVPWLNPQFRARHDLVVNGLNGKVIRWAYVMTNNTIQIGTNDGQVVTV